MLGLSCIFSSLLKGHVNFVLLYVLRARVSMCIGGNNEAAELETFKCSLNLADMLEKLWS